MGRSVHLLDLEDLRVKGPALPELVERPPDAITQWVIYDHPTDYPHGFVLRPQFSAIYFNGIERFGRITELHSHLKKAVVIASPIAWYAKTADELRGLLPYGSVLLGRMPGDDAKILEVWMDMRT